MWINILYQIVIRVLYVILGIIVGGTIELHYINKQLEKLNIKINKEKDDE